MDAVIDKESTLTKLLTNLVELDFDAIEAYQAAIDRLENASYESRLREFLRDHQRHTSDLGDVLEEMGEEAPKSGDMLRFLTKGKVVIGGLIGDKQILMAMKANEEVTNKAYEEAVRHAGVTAVIRAILERNLADERRHRAWIDETLEQMRRMDKAEKATGR